MQKMISPWSLGASLYMPAIRMDILEIIVDQKFIGLKSLIICLEDAVGDSDLEFAIQNLQTTLSNLQNHLNDHPYKERDLPKIFIRPRNLEMAEWIAQNVCLKHITGFVLPKFDRETLDQWWAILAPTSLMAMPTLENDSVYDAREMHNLAEALREHPFSSRIVVLRIGGNDLMNGLRLRRDKNVTLYESPLGYVIKMLVAVFVSKGFYLTAPVCEHFDDTDLLKKELGLDLLHGLVGKTVIHPKQIAIVNDCYKVSLELYKEAKRILASTAAVFKSNGSMCEPVTHYKWAIEVIERAKIYGLDC